MDRNTLRQVILEQKEIILNEPYVRREYELEPNINYCFVGMRRSGKSFLMYHQIHEFLNSGGEENHFTYVNFEDERLLEMKTEDLNLILEIAHELAGPGIKPLLFLDEIHNVAGWDHFARRLADMKYRVSITGSNSKMLSSEIASTLGARFMVCDVYPYSFREYRKADHGSDEEQSPSTTAKRAETISQFNEYRINGGFPELLGIKGKKPYLNNIFNTVLLGDIITRNSISNPFAMRLIIKKLAESIMTPLSYSRLTNVIAGTGLAIGKSTVINYVDYAKEAFLFFSIQNYASKLADKETNPKYYFVDHGLIGLFVNDPVSLQLENLVAVELRRRFGKENVFFFERNVEVDFYVPDANIAIQVCKVLHKDDATFKRETEALIKLAGFLPGTECLILTDSEEEKLTVNDVNISVLPIWKWLLKENS